jgi:hypothetical protein
VSRHDYIHPALRPLVNAVAGTTAQLAYRDLLKRLAESAPEGGYSSLRALPELSLEDLAATLAFYPTAFMDSVADADPDLGTLCIERLNESRQKASDRYTHIGLLVVGYVRNYVKGLVLRDVLLECERLREAEAIERDSNPHDDGALS